MSLKAKKKYPSPINRGRSIDFFASQRHRCSDWNASGNGKQQSGETLSKCACSNGSASARYNTGHIRATHTQTFFGFGQLVTSSPPSSAPSELPILLAYSLITSIPFIPPPERARDSPERKARAREPSSEIPHSTCSTSSPLHPHKDT